ncbi:MAG: WD40 repeat domain-containing protein [Candidatus Sulfotelmatobacter sp.]
MNKFRIWRSRLMRDQSSFSATSLIVLSLFGWSAAAGQSPTPLSLEAQIPMPDVKGRIDHLSVDVRGQRLFVAAVENHSVEIVDLKSGKDVHTLTDLAEPQGVFYEPSTNRLFVACGDGVTKIFDGTTFEVLKTVKFTDDADNIRYDQRDHQVIVGYAGAKQLRNREDGDGGLGFLDSNGKKTGDVVIDAHPESFQLEKSGSRIFVNVPDKKEIEVIDLARRGTVVRWPIASEENNFPMALDESHNRLLVGCWVPPRLLVFDTDTGKQTASAEIAGKTDDLFYDADRAHVYVLTSPGFLEVFQQNDPDHYARVASYSTPPGTQTGLFVPEWGKLFAAVRRQGDQSAEIRVYQAH